MGPSSGDGGDTRMRSPVPATGWSPSHVLPWDPMAPGAVGAGAMMRTGGGQSRDREPGDGIALHMLPPGILTPPTVG